MQGNKLNGMRVAILATEDFELVELTEPKKALEQAGATTKVFSPRPGTIQGMNHDVEAGSVNVDMTLDQANPDEFDAVMLPGGALNADDMRMQPKAREFVKRMQAAGKPFAVICHAPWLLVSSGLVRGRTLTSWPSIQDDIRNAGGNWVDQQVVGDGNWVTSRGPKDLPAFNPAMIRLFSENRIAAR